MTTTQAPTMGALDRRVSAEIRAQAARLGLTQKKLAERMGRPELWVSRRLSALGGRHVSINFEELELFAKALETSWLDLLPRVDSNHQPAGYLAGDLSDFSLGA